MTAASRRDVTFAELRDGDTLVAKDGTIWLRDSETGLPLDGEGRLYRVKVRVEEVES